MYILFGILILICILFSIICFYKRKTIIKKICSMDCCEKIDLLNRFLTPFGFYYVPKGDIVTSNIDAWQKTFGYRADFDHAALHFNMVFDCEKVYFYYCGKTWLIEFWKGQYGINIGGEIGIYRVNEIVPPEKFSKTTFYGVSDNELLPLSMELNYKGQKLFSISKNHWWLTGFRVGSYCNPEDLTMDIKIDFPDYEMLTAFLDSIKRLNYSEYDLYVCDTSVSFMLGTPHCRQPRYFHRILAAFSLWQDRIFCKLFNFVTRPFTCTVDKILYLYFFLPRCFRHLFRFKKCRKQKCRKCCKKKHKKCCKKKCEKPCEKKPKEQCKPECKKCCKRY